MVSPVVLSDAELTEIRQFDSATISNAIELLGVRDRTVGYMGLSVRCLLPHRTEPMVGYAVTAKADSTTYGRSGAGQQIDLWELVERSPKPAILVMQDISTNPTKSCHCGDVMCTVLQALGGIGVVTDGGVRDVTEVDALGMHYFARGSTVSHGTTVQIEPGEPVVVDGLPIKTGDLLHGDANGVVSVPLDAATRVAEAARMVVSEENARREFVRTPGFTVAKFREFLGS